MDEVSAVMLLRAFAGIATLYALLRCLVDWRDSKWGWAIAGLIVTLAGIALSFATVPIYEAQIRVQEN